MILHVRGDESMTVEDILRKLEELAKPGDFKVYRTLGQQTVRAKNGRCPVCWLADMMGMNPANTSVLIDFVHIAPKDAQGQIAAAADYPDAIYRERLLKACKLL